MKSYTQLLNMFTTLSQNNTTANQTLGGILLNDQHRYLLLNYFDNERTVYLVTIGSGTAATLTSQSAGGTTATLTSTWTNISVPQLVVFSSGEQRTVNFVQNSATITWTPALTQSAGTNVTLNGAQFYPLPANVSKVKNPTITVGQLVYSPAPVQSVQEWTKLNALPYNSNIPAYFFVYGGKIGFWPIPSTSGEVISLNCQIAVPDMTYQDYTAGTLAASGMVAGSNAVIGSSTNWSSGSFPTLVDLSGANLYITATPPGGDGLPYQVYMFNSATSATLTKPVVSAPNISGASYTIGQYPLLDPNFHDAIAYGALRIYYNSIVKDPDKYQLYDKLFGEKTDLMKKYLATKQVNVDLSVTPVLQNPNLFINGT